MLNRTETRQPDLTVAAFVDVPYSPALLLESSFDVSVIHDLDFRSGCEWGYNAYFENMCEWDGAHEELIVVPQHYTWPKIVAFVVETAGAVGCFRDKRGDGFPFAWHAGFGLGWLSALALTNRHEAMMGLAMLTALIIPLASHRTLVA